jgi:hypothetical protein
MAFNDQFGMQQQYGQSPWQRRRRSMGMGGMGMGGYGQGAGGWGSQAMQTPLGQTPYGGQGGGQDVDWNAQRQGWQATGADPAQMQANTAAVLRQQQANQMAIANQDRANQEAGGVSGQSPYSGPGMTMGDWGGGMGMNLDDDYWARKRRQQGGNDQMMYWGSPQQQLMNQPLGWY